MGTCQDSRVKGTVNNGIERLMLPQANQITWDVLQEFFSFFKAFLTKSHCELLFTKCTTTSLTNELNNVTIYILILGRPTLAT
ncbi:hypothetical protein BpHYR1_008091 [Brachionus plicatilis]|uniref:Uncharacterized protein n=1 Tax=Brachionus plicatilis TaxID=10195 RepID=A0A3M7PY38_BRAPC|nr:hypothetical protein BpHYR1_008091 [Brachionus plicatilis]